MSKNLLLYPHGGSGNRGCEAIIRSSAKIVGSNYKILLYSSDFGEDREVGLDKICQLKPDKRPIRKLSLRHLTAAMRSRFMGDVSAFDKILFSPILKNKKSDIALSIGGDNYCYGTPSFIYIINQELRRKGIRTVLWGCSIEPDAIDDEMLDDLKGYSRIFARESATYNAMRTQGLTNVSLYPDPAFLLERIDYQFPNGLDEGNIIGINVSPLIMKLEKESGIVLRNYLSLIRHILDHTDMCIALIPHVIWNHNDDRTPLRYLEQYFRESGRVFLLEGYPAEVLKGFIARCRFMVAARTHASIAAYSECVPTLVVGYSIKAKGIAEDIFGEWHNLVLDVHQLSQETQLSDAFDYLIENEQFLRTYLQSKMPAYKDLVWGMAKELEEL